MTVAEGIDVPALEILLQETNGTIEGLKEQVNDLDSQYILLDLPKSHSSSHSFYSF
jgi:hypothetical protein